jgi:carnitine O-acetyltransferase
MVKQLAYGKMNNGRPAVTYESAQTRKFRLGRTEVIRVASRESKAFVESMLDQGRSVSAESRLGEEVNRGRLLTTVFVA